MNNLTIMRGLQLAAGATLLLFASVGHAQFVWVDAKGVKQFSDRPPPQGTPQKNILKARNMKTASDEAPAPVAAAPEVPKAVPASLADREADYRKRKTEQAEAEKKAGIAAENVKIKAAACTAARQQKAQIDTGTPIRDTNEERSWLDDKQRAERKTAAEKTIAEHCG
jgi:hypothetical protein